MQVTSAIGGGVGYRGSCASAASAAREPRQVCVHAGRGMMSIGCACQQLRARALAVYKAHGAGAQGDPTLAPSQWSGCGRMGCRSVVRVVRLRWCPRDLQGLCGLGGAAGLRGGAGR